MATPVKMPQMGESVVEGTILKWLKSEGDSVELDEPIVEVSTDKVDTEIPSPIAGTLVKILVSHDDLILPGKVSQFVSHLHQYLAESILAFASLGVNTPVGIVPGVAFLQEGVTGVE
jgi:pyruvate dehydrogenase E2 component (dihydrolipoamide acetyltransferase)